MKTIAKMHFTKMRYCSLQGLRFYLQIGQKTGQYSFKYLPETWQTSESYFLTAIFIRKEKSEPTENHLQY